MNFHSLIAALSSIESLGSFALVKELLLASPLPGYDSAVSMLATLTPDLVKNDLTIRMTQS